jgi:hypothetical protein
MTMRHCQEHQDEFLKGEEKSKEWAKRNVVVEKLPGGLTMVRRRNDQKKN